MRLLSRLRELNRASEYVPHGGAARLFESEAPEVLLSGPAGCGKSRACLEKVHRLLQQYPHARALIVRKTRESLSESALFTYEEKVLGPTSPICAGADRHFRQVYHYPNGAEIIVGGMDKAGKFMSTEFDLAYVPEAIELVENDWEVLTARLRNGVLPYQQLMGDTNPAQPTHWLKRRCEAGRTAYLESRHEDNPELWDRQANDWTAKGREYVLGNLERLTGPRKQRLRHGIWCQAEGIVFENWEPERHLISPAAFRKVHIERWVGGQDWGFSNPGCLLLIAVDGDGRMYVARQVYHSGRDIDWWTTQAQALNAKHPFEAVLCDPAEPGSIAKYARGGVPAFKGDNNVRDGLNAITARLQNAGDGRPRLFVVEDSLDSADPTLREKGLPTDLTQEFVSYVWAPDPLGVNSKEKPLDAYNHALSALRYATLYVDESGAGWTS